MIAVTILGCGSSGGVPRVGPTWGDCDPAEPRNRRLRCSLLVEQHGPSGTTRVLIDSSPDLREQLLTNGVTDLDAVLYTHPHADHIHGIDDLRQIVYLRRARLPVWADDATSDSLLHRFDYAFVQPPGSSYPPILDLHRIDGDVTIDGAGGPLSFAPFQVEHGRIHALGFRFADIAYLPDVNVIPDPVWPNLMGLRLWIVDALQRAPHPSHSHLDQTLDWIARAAPERAVLTNMHLDLDYRTVAAETPDHIEPAYDGMRLELPA